MLLTVVHQNGSPTLRGGGTTVPIEQSVPFSKLYVYKASFIRETCLYLEPSIIVVFSHSGDAGWSMHGRQPLIFLSFLF